MMILSEQESRSISKFRNIIATACCIYCGLAFGISFSLLIYFFRGLPAALASFFEITVVSGGMCGLGATQIIVEKQVNGIKRYAPELFQEDSLFPYTKTKYVMVENMGVQDFKEQVIFALKHLEEKVKIKESKNLIVGIVPANKETYGEKIQVRFEDSLDGIHVYVSSKPRFFTAFLDYGKNYRNTNFICEYLNSVN